MRIKKLLYIILIMHMSVSSAESLFSDNAYTSLLSDDRSYKEGQILTVLIYEAATASSATGTETNRSNSVGLSVTGTNTQNAGNLAIDTNFDGGGDLSRSGKFVASVSVKITKVYDNGDVHIAGEQLLAFNNEQQQITVEGDVRVDDISEKNTIISTRIADAKIRYLGEGLLSERERPGYITQFFNWLF